ncbi:MULTISPECIES: phage baseplate assembly protein V [Yersinia pseudotuberculosis complex]|uniref:Phage baseplate assembly protein V n=3 Tax=Yersinia pseudotuberculosis complex TaxID=1649845 RepID=A0ABM7AH44_YERPU|nr:MULTISPECIES: phage baseplate assembly protein V [Yersinia pseudotuberculosis complex]AJJ58912.1 phage baseplate assembly V family protein [Yersinia pseudotuberculosis YPIII]AYW86339.1 phage baseplate assembly protein V [Yersinia pseudotuberculosis]AYW91654.1 phage baseplate assembly protein V [Yersinia pseudotuberculosis]AYW95974.1 phage baseplate assembly protein V [Yersinia pseudotuberculosis]AYX00976.1 phage baseplate assembly protein V [Yersinia pseudotuberculosis]
MWNSVDGRINTALNRIRKAFRAVLTRVNSGGQVQTVQARALAGEQLQDNELFQHYGFTSNPLPGTMAVILPLGGNTSHGVIIATEHGAYRLAGLQSGEVALYTDEGAKIVLKRGRIIDVECDTYRVTCKNYEVNAEEKADFNTPMVTASEQVTAQNKITGNGGMAIKGGTGATFEGNINQTSGNYETTGDVKAGSISLLKHHHIDSMSGSTSGAKA